MKSVSARFLSTIVLFLCLHVLHARQLEVCQNGCDFASLQIAIDNAAAGDTIVLKVTGNFVENQVSISKNIFLKGLGSSTTTLLGHAIRGKSLHRIFYVSGGARVTIEDLTIKNGKENADASNWKGAGGGLLIEGTATAVTLNNVQFSNCDFTGPGNGGGAIALKGQATQLFTNNCLFDNNIANNGGAGGIWLAAVSGECLIRNTGFKNNIADNGSGGAVVIEDGFSATFIGCNFSGNQALNRNNGGAIASGASIPTFNNCIFSRNMAGKEGGAIKVAGADLANCSFYYNTAENGGAISRSAELAGHDLYLTNCNLINNSATGFGPAVAAGLFNASSTAIIHMTNTVINKSTSGIDLYSYAASSLGTNQKNTVGRAKFTTGSVRFMNN